MIRGDSNSFNFLFEFHNHMIKELLLISDLYFKTFRPNDFNDKVFFQAEAVHNCSMFF